MSDLVAATRMVAILLVLAVAILVFGKELRPLVELLVRWVMRLLTKEGTA